MTTLFQFIQQCMQSHRLLCVAGMGGLAAEAAHLSAELVVRYTPGQSASPCIDLTSNNAIITAALNDYGPEAIFTRQLEAFNSFNPLVLLLSGSGTSPAIVAAAQYCENNSLQYLLITANPVNYFNCLKLGNTTAECQEEFVKEMHKALVKLTQPN